MLCFSCLARMSPPKHNYLHTRCAHSGCPSWLSFITVLIQAHASWLSEKPSCTKILLYAPHASHSYCVKLQRQEYTERRTPDNIYRYIYEKSQFNSLVWDSLTLAPTTTHGSHFGSDMVAYMGYAHHTGYCMYYCFCGSDSDLSRSGTTENSCARED